MRVNGKVWVTALCTGPALFQVGSTRFIFLSSSLVKIFIFPETNSTWNPYSQDSIHECVAQYMGYHERYSEKPR